MNLRVSEVLYVLYDYAGQSDYDEYLSLQEVISK